MRRVRSRGAASGAGGPWGAAGGWGEAVGGCGPCSLLGSGGAAVTEGALGGIAEDPR